jgi:hypothetical protein
MAMEDSRHELFEPFYVRDCALSAIATGCRAQTLGEFRDRLRDIPGESIYYHFWRQSIEASLMAGGFFNDFSHWAHYHLHDDILAERLALIDPSAYVDLEKLRFDIIEIIEERLDELEFIPACAHVDAFHFIQSKIVVFDTNYTLRHPRDLVNTLPQLPPSAIFYHFIDARRREPSRHMDDFTTWLQNSKDTYGALIDQLARVDPYFIPLLELRDKLSAIVMEFFVSTSTEEKK